MKKMLFAVCLVVGLLVAGNALATTLSYTDSTLAAGDNITYTLNFNPIGTSTTNYSATFTIANSANVSPEWYAGYFDFKFDGSTPGTITSITSPAGTGPWTAHSTPNNVNVLQGGGNYAPFTQDGFYGFTQQGIEQGQTVDITTGVLLTGLGATQTFTFDFTVVGSVNLTDIPFQVGYYDGLTGSGNPQFNQLSKDLTTTVPEPSVLLLLGAGLVGLGGVARRVKKS